MGITIEGYDVDLKVIQDLNNKVVLLLYGNPIEDRTILIRFIKMEGIGYTEGLIISLNIDYFKQTDEKELYGVITHELVHCWQNSNKTPSGVIEGIADYVRLTIGYIPKHWKKSKKKWDMGYEGTAYFFEWIEQGFAGFIIKLNQSFQNEWNDEIFENITGITITDLWDSYIETF